LQTAALAALPRSRDYTIISVMEKRQIPILIGCWVAGLAAFGGELTFEAGASCGLTLGGYVMESRPVYGAECVARMDPGLSMELSCLFLTDPDEEERQGITMNTRPACPEITSLGLMARFSAALGGGKLRGYGGMGILYNLYGPVRARIEGIAANPGIIRQTDPEPTVRLSNSLGFLVAAGLEWPLRERVLLFGEYRFPYLHPRSRFAGLEADGPLGEYVIRAFLHDVAEQVLGVLRIGIHCVF
jgi:hypothetical protein